MDELLFIELFAVIPLYIAEFAPVTCASGLVAHFARIAISFFRQHPQPNLHDGILLSIDISRIDAVTV